VYLSSYDNEFCPVSVNEISEIYLAIRGNDPEKIPSTNSLGFDIEAVVSALRMMDGKHENGTEKHLASIDEAARLAGFLLNSVSFKNYSGRVALMAGILFLKRSGYSFDGDTIEDSWPEGNDFESVKKWFEKVSFKAKDI
jgi:hypothetical protein